MMTFSHTQKLSPEVGGGKEICWDARHRMTRQGVLGGPEKLKGEVVFQDGGMG